MMKNIKKWVSCSVTYLNFGFWIGIGVGIGFTAVMLIYGLY
jgi:hypothetical protein